jgi:hypothetical protein
MYFVEFDRLAVFLSRYGSPFCWPVKCCDLAGGKLDRRVGLRYARISNCRLVSKSTIIERARVLASSGLVGD